MATTKPIIYKGPNYTVIYDQRGRTGRQRSARTGPRVVYNDIDLGAYPELTNDKVLARLKGGESLVEIILEATDAKHGHGLSALWKGPRSIASPQLRKWLEEHGDEGIIDLQVTKQPVSSYITRFLDLISLGNFSKKKRELGYNDIEHWGVNVTTNKGSYLIERNAVVEARDLKAKAKDMKIVDVNAKIPDNLTIRAMIENAADNNPNFWRYNADSNNCQVLVKDILTKNNIDHNDEATIQDARELVDSVGTMKPVINKITDAGVTMDRLIHGDGTKRKRVMKAQGANKKK